MLDRASTIAPAGFNRWLVPPAAIAVHMCIGQVYGFSVFKKPLATSGWSEAEIGVSYSIALALLMGLLVLAQAYWMPWMVPGK